MRREPSPRRARRAREPPTHKNTHIVTRIAASFRIAFRVVSTPAVVRATRARRARTASAAAAVLAVSGAGPDATGPGLSTRVTSSISLSSLSEPLAARERVGASPRGAHRRGCRPHARGRNTTRASSLARARPAGAHATRTSYAPSMPGTSFLAYLSDSTSPSRRRRTYHPSGLRSTSCVRCRTPAD